MHKSTKDTYPSTMRSSGSPGTNCKSSCISPYIPLTPLPGCKPRGSTRQCQLSVGLQTSQDQTEPHPSRMPHSLGTPGTISTTTSSSDSRPVPTSPALRTAAPSNHGTYEDILESFKGPYYGWHWVYSSGALVSRTPGRMRGYPDGETPVEGVGELDGAGVGVRN